MHTLTLRRRCCCFNTFTEDSGFFKAIEEGKSEEEALAAAQGAAAPTIHTPYEPTRPAFAAAALSRAGAGAQPVVFSAVERRRAAPSYGFAARFLQ